MPDSSRPLHYHGWRQASFHSYNRGWGKAGPHPSALFSLVPTNNQTRAILAHANNSRLVSLIPNLRGPKYPKGIACRLNIGFHIGSKSYYTCWKTSPQRYHVMRLVGEGSWQESEQLRPRSKFLEISSTTYIENKQSQSFSPITSYSNNTLTIIGRNGTDIIAEGPSHGSTLPKFTRTRA